MSETESGLSLEFATTDQILDELGRRYPHVLLAFTAMPHDSLSNTTDTDVVYRGGFIPAIGLAVYAQYEFLHGSPVVEVKEDED